MNFFGWVFLLRHAFIDEGVARRNALHYFRSMRRDKNTGSWCRKQYVGRTGFLLTVKFLL